MRIRLLADIEKGSLAGPVSYQIIDLFYEDGDDEKSLIYDGYNNKIYKELEEDIGMFFSSENNHQELKKYLSDIINIKINDISIFEE